MNPVVLETLEFESGARPGASVIVLHGLGADGNDFVPICEALDLSAVGSVRYVFPNAPTRPVTINGGYVMRAWYDIMGADAAGVRRDDVAGLRQSQAAIAALIDHEVARGVPASRIVLAGFSQGCAMALMTGVRHPARLAGIVGMSGYLPLAATTAGEASPANAGVPVFMAHGRFDPMVTLDRAVAARDHLTTLGYPVEWHEYPIEHSVSPDEVADLNTWLVRVLAL